MPTIIGRFNELLHHLSSSSSATSVPSTVRQPTTTSSSRPIPTTNRSSHHHQVHRHSSLSSADRQNTVRRSNSASSRTKPIVSVSKPSRSSKTEDHSGSSGHRSRHRPSSSGPSLQHHSSSNSNSQNQRQPSQQPSRRELVPRRESTAATSHHQSRRQQLSSSSSSGSRRRHSIASVASVNSNSNANQQLIKKPPVAASSMKSSKKTSTAITTNSHNNNNSSKTTIPTVMPNNGDSTNSESDESLASKFARKMKLSAITRKSSGCGGSSNPKITKPSDNISKKQLKANKKSAEEEAKKLELSSKECFINRYLNGQLNKKHPDIISGKTCYDLPIKDIEKLESGVVSSCTGPGGGLLNVVTAPPKPFDLADDVDFIDEDYPDSSLSSAGADLSPQTPKSSASTTSSDAGATLTSSDGTGSPSSGYGIKGANLDLKDVFHDQQPIAGIYDWKHASDFAYGISTSLYESHPSTKLNAGDPIADSFAVCVRENSSIVTLADGVNWGEKASLASRCAVFGCMDYLNRALYSTAESTRIKNTLDIFVALLRSFNAAHNLILAQGGHLTTLCAAVICQLKNSNRFVVCTCNVGDSLAYVYSPLYGVREITQESHDIFSMRDMRDALGALGPVSGSEPELNNLTVAMTIVDAGDIVFLTSDGISDNFDPVVGKFAMAKKETETNAGVTAETEGESKQQQQQQQGGDKSTSSNSSHNKTRKAVQRSNSNPEKSTARKLGLNSANYTSRGLPLVSAQQRHELTLLRMEDLIMNGVNDISTLNNHSKKTAKELCTLMVDFSTKLTMAKRHILEDPELYPDDDEDGYGSEAFGKQRQRRRLVGHKLVQVPGKLDHASIAAIEVGFYGNLAAAKKIALHPQLSHHHHLPVSFNNNNKARASSHPKDYLHSDRNTNNNNHNGYNNYNNNNNNNNNKIDDPRYDLKMKATLARFESQDFLECCCEAGPI